MSKRIDSIQAVAEHNLCTGCGVCAAVQPAEIQMVDSADGQRRPVMIGMPGKGTRAALAACPGAHLDLPNPGAPIDGDAIWGPVLEVWEGWASDPELRYAGSSGGVVSALALHQITSGEAGAVMHVKPDPGRAVGSVGAFSRSRAEILEGAGSRYAPASPGEKLGEVASLTSPSAVIGKPCDIAGSRQAADRWPDLREKLGLTIAIFCAGTPSYEGADEAIRAMGMDPGSIAEVRFRGMGWPGRFTATDRDGNSDSLSYAESWQDILQRHRQWRCRICPDHTGEFADISVGDPWYREIAPGDPGRSLVVVRSERGREAIRAAITDGAVHLERVDPIVLARSQPNLVKTRGSVWGRLVTMRLLGMPTPEFKGLPSFRTFVRRLTWREKGQATVGTAKRVLRRGLREAAPVQRAPGHG